MLPEVLSADLCSLIGGVDRYSCIVSVPQLGNKLIVSDSLVKSIRYLCPFLTAAAVQTML